MKATLVEDDLAVRKVLSAQIRSCGFDVTAFPDAESALAASQVELAPLNILDWGLPGMDGLELCRRMRALPGGKDCLILVLTGRKGADDYNITLEAGADDYLTKPIPAEALRVRLKVAEKRLQEISARKEADARLRLVHEELEKTVIQRTQELRATNEALHGKVQDLQLSEKIRERLLEDLGKRVKELQCMYGVSEAIRRQGPLEIVFHEIAKGLPEGWRHSRSTVGRICFDGVEYASGPFPETQWHQTSDIVVDGVSRGTVEVCYTDEYPEEDEGPFLEEERALIDNIAGMLVEVVERKRREEEAKTQQERLFQADKLISLGTLVSGVAHEINNPNQFIMSHLAPLARVWEDARRFLDTYYENNGDFLLGGAPYSEMRNDVSEMLASSKRGSERIKRIVDELREFVAEQPVQRSEELQLNRVVNSAIALLSGTVKKSTERFFVELDEELPFVRGDYQRLEQVLINLVQNACQALPDSSRGIWVTTRVAKDKQSVIVEVRDEGVGIDPDDLNRIADLFFTTKRDAGGTGLGLAISSSIVAEHGGTLTFVSNPNEGTTATVTLPVSNRD